MIGKGLYWVSEPQADEEMPSCLAMSRRISEMVTFSITWSRPRIVSELTTSPPSPTPPAPLTDLTKLAAMSAARCASSAEFTSPVRMIELPIVRTLIWVAGNAARRICDSSPMSRPMLISNEAISRPWRSRANSEVWPAAEPIT